MSADDYVRGIVQKYKLSVAIGVIKSKPKEQSIEAYLNDLRRKINDNDFHDQDDTVCSDDFALDDDDDVTFIDLCDDDDKNIYQSVFQNNDNNTRNLLNVCEEKGAKNPDKLTVNSNPSNTETQDLVPNKVLQDVVFKENKEILNKIHDSGINDTSHDVILIKDRSKNGLELEPIQTSSIKNTTDVTNGKPTDLSNIHVRNPISTIYNQVTIANYKAQNKLRQNKNKVSKPTVANVTTKLNNTKFENYKQKNIDAYKDNNNGDKIQATETTIQNNVIEAINEDSVDILQGYNNFINSNDNVKQVNGDVGFEAFEILKEVVRVDADLENSNSTQFSFTQSACCDNTINIIQNPGFNTIKKTTYKTVARNVNKELNHFDDTNVNDTKKKDARKKNSKDLNDYDSQATELYTVPEFRIDTHVSQSQVVDISLPDKYIFGSNRDVIDGDMSNENQIELLESRILREPQYGNFVYDINIEERVNDIYKDQTADESNLHKDGCPKNNSFMHMEENISHNENNHKTIESHNATDGMIPQDNGFCNAIEDNNINNKNCDHYSESSHKASQPSNVGEIIATGDTNFCMTLNGTQTNYHKSVNSEKVNKLTESCSNGPKQNDFTYINSASNNNINAIKNGCCEEVDQLTKPFNAKERAEGNKNILNSKLIENNEVMEVDEFTEDLTQTQTIYNEERTSQTEIIPFKVLEELNKVKKELKGRDRRPERRVSCDSVSTDAGYRSDSQCSQRSSLRTSLQSSCNRLDQSGHCLLNFIQSCPQVATTTEIIKEISQVLGQLIDKLHEEENYPTFLQQFLVTIDDLLNQIYTGRELDCYMNQKDELVHKLVLLNSSIHVIKYTIQKITIILEKVIKDISNRNIVYEIHNAVESENLCYIFNITQCLLTKYIKLKSISNQNQSNSEAISQNNRNPVTTVLSQSNSGKVLKKSSISDIWRKKWNLNYKEEELSKREEKECVLLKFGEILNKLVVETIDGYSLLSFAALQCFNILQS